MQDINFHKDSAAYFDGVANSLLLQLKPIHIQEAPPDYKPDFAIDGVITESEIIGAPVFNVGGHTKFLGFNGNKIGLDRGHYHAFLRLVDKVFRNPICRERVSSKAVEKSIFKWMEEKYRGQMNEEMTSFLEKDSERLLRRELFMCRFTQQQ